MSLVYFILACIVFTALTSYKHMYTCMGEMGGRGGGGGVFNAHTPNVVSHGQPIHCYFYFAVNARKRSGD